jgi:hypothetical protein
MSGGKYITPLFVEGSNIFSSLQKFTTDFIEKRYILKT